MSHIAWLGELALTDAPGLPSAAARLAVESVLERARDDFIWMDELRVLLCGMGHHDVHRMSDDEVLRAVADHVEVGNLAILPAQALMQMFFSAPETLASVVSTRPEPESLDPPRSSRNVFGASADDDAVPPRSYSVRGSTSGRPYNPQRAGGPIERLDHRGASITAEGIAEVRIHTSRFEDFIPNRLMIERLEKIAAGKLEPTEYDLRYYTHERRELARYRRLGISDAFDPGYDVWNDTHTATLEDYGIADKDPSGNPTLYHPETWSSF